MRTYSLKTGDTKPMRATLSYADGTPLDLTGATVGFFMGTTINNGACTVIDPLNGVVEYPWQTGDTAAAGTFSAEFNVTIAGSHQRVPSKGTLQVVITAAVVG